MSSYAEWGKRNFKNYSKAIAFIEVIGESDFNIGSCFHVGNGVYVTARHVLDGYKINNIGIDSGFDPFKFIGSTERIDLELISGPFYHPDTKVDLACFTVKNPPTEELPLGGHLDCFLGPHELLLHRTLVLGFPRVPLTESNHLIACLGEINGLVETYIGSKHPSFIISTMARGGFSGSPVLVAYDEENTITGTAVLGVVTQSLVHDDKPAESGFMTITTIEPIYDMLNHHGLLPKTQELELDPR